MEKKQEGFATYLCVQAPKLEYTFEQRIIDENRQLRLLPIQNRGEQYYIEIQDKKDFLTLFSEKTDEYELICIVLSGMVDCLEQLNNFLLKPDSVMLKPETIFLDNNRQVHLCYVPGYEGNIQRSFCLFMEYLMKHINHHIDNLVVLVYGIYHIVREEQYSLKTVRVFLEEREKKLNEVEDVNEMQKTENIEEKDFDSEEHVVPVTTETSVCYQQRKMLIKLRKRCILSVMAALLLLLSGATLYEDMYIYHTMAQGGVLPAVSLGCVLGFIFSFYNISQIYKIKKNK